jgi:iron transport multicopper oxidase
VIYDPNDPQKGLYDVDDGENLELLLLSDDLMVNISSATTVLTLADWYDVPSKDVGVPPTNQATLINGQGRNFNASAQAANVPLAVVNVVKGKR